MLWFLLVPIAVIVTIIKTFGVYFKYENGDLTFGYSNWAKAQGETKILQWRHIRRVALASFGVAMGLSVLSRFFISASWQETVRYPLAADFNGPSPFLVKMSDNTYRYHFTRSDGTIAEYADSLNSTDTFFKEDDKNVFIFYDKVMPKNAYLFTIIPGPSSNVYEVHVPKGTIKSLQ